MTASAIEWTERSDWNPLRGCARVSEGCRHCYAEQIAGRFSDPGQPFHGFATRTPAGGRWTGKIAIVDDRLTLPLRWRKPATIFASSTSDIFHESLSDADIDRIFAVMALTPHHTYQVLTKRAERMRAYIADPTRPSRVARAILDLAAVDGAVLRAEPWPVVTIGDIDDPSDVTTAWPCANVWLGVSVENQPTAEARIPQLIRTPAAKHFLSCEPLLDAIDLTRIDINGDAEMDALNAGSWEAEIEQWRDSSDTWEEDFEDFYGQLPNGLSGPMHPTIDWVIVGGESGQGARPMHPEWARALRDQCAAANVPFFFKQWGEWAPVSDIDTDALDNQLYHPAPARDPEATRRCKVETCVLHRTGLRFADGEWEKSDGGERILAFQAGHGGMMMMRIGKARAGRTLGGVQHDGVPA